MYTRLPMWDPRRMKVTKKRKDFDGGPGQGAGYARKLVFAFYDLDASDVVFKYSRLGHFGCGRVYH